MKKTYLFLTVTGTILPNIFVFKEGIESGNYMLYTYPLDTMKAMFASNISSAFITDLLFVVVLFLFWTYRDAKQKGVKGVYWVWLYTFILGLAGGLPLYLYLKEKNQRNSY